MKPSEMDPGACMMLVQLAKEAGVPDGVLNVIHGQKEGQFWAWSLLLAVCVCVCVCIRTHALVDAM